MLLYSSLKLFAIGAIIGLALLGTFFYIASRRGLLRNGYFGLPAVVLIVGALFVAFQLVAYAATIVTIGGRMEQHPIIALTINGLMELAILLLGSVLISRIVGQNPFAVFRLEGFYDTPRLAYFLAIPIILVAQVAGEAISAIWVRLWKFFPDIFSRLDQYESASDTSLQGLVTAHGVLEFLPIFIFVALVPAFAEETLFRGFAQTNIERSGHWHARPVIALLGASFLFALMHGSMFKLPGLFMLGLALGWMAYRTSNLFVGSLAHAANNGFIVLMLYLNPASATANAGSNLVAVDQLGARDALVLLAFVLPVLFLFVYWFGRITERVDARGNAEREVQEWVSRAESESEFDHKKELEDQHG